MKLWPSPIEDCLDCWWNTPCLQIVPNTVHASKFLIWEARTSTNFPHIDCWSQRTQCCPQSVTILTFVNTAPVVGRLKTTLTKFHCSLMMTTKCVTLEAKKLTKADLSRVLHKSSPPAPIAIRRDGFIWTSQPWTRCQLYWRHQTFCSLPSPSIQCLLAQRWIIFINSKISVEQFWCDDDDDYEDEKSAKSGRKTFSLACMWKVQEDWVEWAGQPLSWGPPLYCRQSLSFLASRFPGFHKFICLQVLVRTQCQILLSNHSREGQKFKTNKYGF